MSIMGDVRNPSQSGILNGTSKGECWLSDDNTLGVTYSYPVGGCGVFGKIESIEKAKIYFDKVFGFLKALNIHEFEFSTEDAALQEQLLCLFRDRKIEHELEYSYEIYKETNMEIAVPGEYQVELVTELALHKSQVGGQALEILSGKTTGLFFPGGTVDYLHELYSEKGI